MVLRGCTVKRTHHWTTLLGQRWPQTCRRITSWFSFSSIQWRLKVSIRNIHRQILSHFLIRHLKSLVSYLVWCPDYFFERAQRNAVWERDFSPDFAGCIEHISLGPDFPEVRVIWRVYVVATQVKGAFANLSRNIQLPGKNIYNGD